MHRKETRVRYFGWRPLNLNHRRPMNLMDEFMDTILRDRTREKYRHG